MYGRTEHVTFEEVAIWGEKSGKCGCGKRRNRRQKFWGTINPFNKNEDGTVKTRGDIYKGLVGQMTRWKQEPITCKDCEKE